MPVRLSAAQRAEKTARAVELSARGWTNQRIAEELSTTRKTVGTWLTAYYANLSEHRSTGESREKSIAVYEEIVAEGWQRLERLKDTSLNVSGVLNAIRGAQERIDKLSGAEAPVKTQRVDEEIVVEWEDLDAAFAEED